MARPWYAAREQVKAALDSTETARNDLQIDRAIGSASRRIDARMRRVFYPMLATRYFPWPAPQPTAGWRLWLDDNDLIRVDTLTVGGVEIDSADFFLEPVNSGPPYTHVELDLSGAAAFSTSSTHQRAISITGLWGYSADEERIGTLSSTLEADSTDTASAAWETAQLGVGDILRVDDERLIVTGRDLVDSSETITSGLAASASDVELSVSDGSVFATGLMIRVDAERMLVVDVAGSTLTVRRAWDGSVLASHTADTAVYVATGVRLDRAQLGTSIAQHTSGDVVYRHLVPDLIRDLCIAEAVNQLEQETSGYARIIGEGETAREGSGRGLADLRRDAMAAHGRRVRTRVV